MPEIVLGFPPEIPPLHPEAPSREFTPPVPVVYVSGELEKMSLRVYAAIQLRVPESGIDWLDEMIRRARELDSVRPRKRKHTTP